MKYSPAMAKVFIREVADGLSADSAQFIDQTEAQYRKRIESICTLALEQNKRIVLITGPSASGKTTTAKRLADALTAHGKKVNRISLDNFYYPTEQLPRWEDGYQNYESIEGLDISCFKQAMHELLTNHTAAFPIFDFTIGRRSPKTYTLTFDENTYLIIEGIHALNPMVYSVIGDVPALKIYISVHSNFLYDENEILLTARDLRLARRLLRDYHYRATSGAGTLEMWGYVIKGEDLYIRPFRQHADIHIDSTHAYEPFLYHDGLCAMLDEINKNSPYYQVAHHLLQSNQHFFEIPYGLIPPTSLIQEFIKSNYLDQHKIPLIR